MGGVAGRGQAADLAGRYDEISEGDFNDGDESVEWRALQDLNPQPSDP